MLRLVYRILGWVKFDLHALTVATINTRVNGVAETGVTETGRERQICSAHLAGSHFAQQRIQCLALFGFLLEHFLEK